MSVLLETTKGHLIIDLFPKQAPLECSNFLNLCKLEFYKYSLFLNLQKDLSVDIADPLYPIRKQGASFWAFCRETDKKDLRCFEYSNRFYHLDYNSSRQVVSSKTRFLTPTKNNLPKDIGSVGFSISENGTIGLNLRICLDDNGASNLAVFGKVVKGFETLNAINESILDDLKQPVEDIRIRSVHVLHDEGMLEPFSYQVPSIEFPKELYDHVRLDVGDLDYEKVKENDARSQALTLEMIGDLPHANVKPKETTLFVAKLNPSTEDDDLRIIFSRFGEINYCDIVKDRDTGKSMGYGFIDFKRKEDCEKAYFKMQGVLIDDRRVYVDFSQSVWRARKKRKF